MTNDLLRASERARRLAKRFPLNCAAIESVLSDEFHQAMQQARLEGLQAGWRVGRKAAAEAVESLPRHTGDYGEYNDDFGEEAAQVIRALPEPDVIDEEMG